MLSKNYRLTKKGSFNYVYKKGESQQTRPLVLVYIKSKGSIKVGFSVSNKIGKAVIRNKVKRRLRAAVAKYLPQFKCSCQLVFVARLEILTLSYLQIERMVEKLLLKAALI